MIKPLRKYHYLLWALWAFLLPGAFIAAIAVKPMVTADTKDIKDGFTANIASNSDSTMLLTITIGAPVKAPSCLAILSTPQEDLVLGTLNRQGNYSFIVPAFAASGTLNFVDAIHRRTIATIAITKNTSTQ